ncbi:ABC transporter permease [Diplocloster agilis]|uniref:ABC transporter permease n=2 Tax=Diplocloster agilis TaxID=2850323 RepID=A0A949K6K2_9FIRM|nr:ABC transporter permease subunit [Diplocloster agilis]MBU9737098.1 ABC transporter permease [Diplocloster agilis]MBU9746535.1 ABC transporter permease [Diplocloster agilis]
METIETKRKFGKLCPWAGRMANRETKGAGSKSSGLMVLYRKEMADHMHSKRFLIILLLILITSLASLYGALSGIQEAVKDSSDFIFLKLFTTSGKSIPSFVSFIGLLGPFVGLTLGFDAINNERNGGTLNRLVSQPIYRDAVINGKFLAGYTVIVIMVFSMGILIGTAGLVSTGIAPSGEELVRLFVFLIYTTVYIAFWLALSILFSVLCKHAATSALSVIAVWLFFAIFMGLLAGIIANGLFPTENATSMQTVMQNYTWNQNLNRLSPYYLYSEAVSTILNPSVRTVSVITVNQLSGAVAGYLPLGQSLLLVWPHLVWLLALTMIVFAISYVCFMRQEIRSGQ